MPERAKSLLVESTKQLRFLQLTLTLTCLAFLTVMLSERQELISRASSQIDQIYNYTSNWRFNNIERGLGRSHKPKGIKVEKVALVPGRRRYRLCLDKPCKNHVIFHWEFIQQALVTPYSNVVTGLRKHLAKPKTLSEFRRFYNGIGQSCCLYSIVGFSGKEIQHSYYRIQKSVNDEHRSQKYYNIRDIQLKMIDIDKAGNEIVNGNFLAEVVAQNASSSQNMYRLVISSSKSEFDSEEISTYTFPPFLLKKSRFDSVRIANNPHWKYDSYGEQFKALAMVTKDWPEIDISMAKKIVNSEYSRRGDLVKVGGIEFSTGSLRSWGVFLIVGLQFYFLANLRGLTSRQYLFKKNSPNDLFPWLELQRGAYVVAFWLTAVFLPLLTICSVFWVNSTFLPLLEVLVDWPVWLAVISGSCLSAMIGNEHRKLIQLLRSMQSDLLF